jgi:molybdenum-dependent DNA-binding transcriptional regulator ModE
MQYTPPKGSKAEWNRVLGEFVSTALRGVGASGEKDTAKGLAIVEELQKLNKTGHTLFK